ncbi:MAG: hypothetical protein A3E01_10325 [Gammaproteobacteria bacterium RIFCSPHIGHO2_12_FULL_63_22]|nr:MAG: hypothetical protein A3E01_10325 [Gammaproteobacteria bacterium RIFCSPHIGHO2_12_FULL_63_22]
MITLKKLALAAGVCAAGILGATTTFAQSADGFHAIQVFPVVVDTASFTQRFTFRNPNATSLSIAPTYFPGTGTATANSVPCPAIVIAADSDKTFNTLRDVCPALAAGSNFGFLYTSSNNVAAYSGFSRVANPQGNGFSVEAFSANTFTSATSSVSGIRRLAAGGGAPAFQTNCFVANLNDVVPEAVPVTTSINVSVFSSTNVQLGATTAVALAPGKLTRLLDAFAAVGAPGGDHDNARVRFFELGGGEPALMSFCTVQDNTSFGADFRIAKQESSSGSSDAANGSVMGPQDDSARRDMTASEDVRMNSGGANVITRTFVIPGQTFPPNFTGFSNTHVMYFRHPDWVSCEIIDPATGVRALFSHNLEMRMLADDGVTVLAGGNDQQGFSPIYLGDKRSRNAGSNTRYTIEVETMIVDVVGSRPYRLHCQSGSGSTAGDVLRYQELVNRF